jgi:hypothetical protein
MQESCDGAMPYAAIIAEPAEEEMEVCLVIVDLERIGIIKRAFHTGI